MQAQAQLSLQPHDYANAVATLVDKMPLERAVQVYEFARFLQNQPAYPPPIILDDEDCLHDSEEAMAVELTPEQLATEERIWEAAYLANQEEFRALARQALEDLDAGETWEMVIENGKLQ